LTAPHPTISRRRALRGSATLVATGGLALAGSAIAAPEAEEDKEAEVSAVEDLMREHGVLRRILIVYREAAVGPLGRRAAGLAAAGEEDKGGDERAGGRSGHGALRVKSGAGP
jgi:hypothetical protein